MSRNKDVLIVAKIKELKEQGYTIIRSVLTANDVKQILYEKSPRLSGNCLNKVKNCSEQSLPEKSPVRKRRRRSGLQEWLGALETLKAHKISSGGQIEVRAPMTTRGKGRFDFPLSKTNPLSQQMESVLKKRNVNSILEAYVSKGTLATQNIILSEAGASRQRVHTDHHKQDYVTALIPLVKQTKKTGGTRVFPGSHLPSYTFNLDTSSYES